MAEPNKRRLRELQKKKEMKIALIDVDGLNFPNLALMKISAFHKQQGDSVEWANLGKYDRTYKSKIFTFSKDSHSMIGESGEVIKGGTGYGLNVLPPEIDKMIPDFTIYPNKNNAHSYGFLTRGCPNKCSWCIVPKKEGLPSAYSDIEEITQGRKIAILMDNNVLAHQHGLDQIEKIARLGIKVDFNQGLDARIIAKNESIAELLASVKWFKPIRLACDTMSQMESVKEAARILRKHGATPSRFFVYVLLRELADSYQRVNYIKSLGMDAFAQPFRDFTGHDIVPQWQKDLARYTNNKALYKTMDFMDYQPRNGFKCIEYFNQ